MSFNMNRAERREAERYMREQSKKYPAHLIEIPRDQWPERAPPGLTTALRSRDFLVQVFAAERRPGVLARMSISRTALNASGTRWEQGISWDELQRLKAEAGYADFDAVEIYPSAADVVNVANMRHLWVMAEPLPFKWSRTNP